MLFLPLVFFSLVCRALLRVHVAFWLNSQQIHVRNWHHLFVPTRNLLWVIRVWLRWCVCVRICLLSGNQNCINRPRAWIGYKGEWLQSQRARNILIVNTNHKCPIDNKQLKIASKWPDLNMLLTSNKMIRSSLVESSTRMTSARILWMDSHHLMQMHMEINTKGRHQTKTTASGWLNIEIKRKGERERGPKREKKSRRPLTTVWVCAVEC